MASDLSIIRPEATTNLIENPSFEIGTIGYTAVGTGASIAQSLVEQMFGADSGAVTPGADTDAGVYREISLTDGLIYTFSVYVKAADSIPFEVHFADNAGSLVGTPTEFDGNADWQRVVVSYTAVATATHRLYVRKNGSADTSLFYIDALQLEAKAYETTYCDGSLDGCKWAGVAHASTSSRSVQTRAGGRVVDLENYGLRFRAYGALGMPPMEQNLQEWAQLPGAVMQGYKTNTRELTLDAWTETDSLEDLRQLRADLIDLIRPDWGPELEPLILRYSGSPKPVEITCYYDSGLEGEFRTLDYEMLSIRFRCPDPFWYGIGNHAAQLDTSDTLAVNRIIARIDGEWSALGNPTGTGTVLALAVAADGTLYVGGSFSNWNGIADADNIVKYSGGVWSALGTGLNSYVRDIEIAPDGSVYVVGNFTSAGGDANAKGVAKWDGAAWSPIGASTSFAASPPSAVTLGADGKLYVGGEFHTWNGDATKNYLVVWDGSTWSELGSGIDASVSEMMFGPDGQIYVVGSFSSAGGLTIYDKAAKWDPVTSTWSRFRTSGSTVGGVFALAFGPDNTLYVGGSFTTLGGASVSRIARWSGGAWQPLGAGIGSGTDLVNAIVVTQDNELIASGLFTTAGGLTVTDNIARWDGFNWTPFDVDLPGASTVLSMLYDDGDLYLGFDVSGNATVPDVTTIDNQGGAETYPTITLKRSGGTSATLLSLRNLTTGDDLWFDLALIDQETVTIELHPDSSDILSDVRGRVARYLLRGSDLSSFRLLKGENEISALLTEAGSPTVTTILRWVDAYWSVDGAA